MAQPLAYGTASLAASPSEPIEEKPYPKKFPDMALSRYGRAPWIQRENISGFTYPAAPYKAPFLISSPCGTLPFSKSPSKASFGIGFA